MSTALATSSRPPRGRPPIPGVRAAILQAGEDIFTRRDYHQVQMDDVAAAAGVGKGTLYRHFRSKRALYLAVVFDGIGRLRAELTETLRTRETPARQIERVVAATLHFFWDRRRFFVLINQHEDSPDQDTREWLRQRQQLAAIVHEALTRAIASGAVRPIDVGIATEMLFGMLRAANRYRRPTDRPETLVAVVVDFFMNGVGTPTGRRVLARPPSRRT